MSLRDRLAAHVGKLTTRVVLEWLMTTERELAEKLDAIAEKVTALHATVAAQADQIAALQPAPAEPPVVTQDQLDALGAKADAILA